jgi:RNA polymerase sigma-70 factor (ECF subfamily)
VKDARSPSNLQLGPGDEQALMARLLARDQTALGALYDRYARVVYALALRITGSTAEAEDVVVDSFWQVWQQADRYDASRGQLGAWIFTIARSRALDRLRAMRRAPLARPDEQADAARRAAASDNPEENLWLTEQSALVRAALAELTPAQRAAIELAYYHGLSHAEIAERLGEPLGTVKTRIRLGLMKMRESLDAQLWCAPSADAGAAPAD